MAFTKTFLKTKPVCKATFQLSPEEVQHSQNVYIVGDFNGWNTTSHPMKKKKDGGFSLEISLDSGKDYQFRYLLDSGAWINDGEADAYIPCSFSGENNSLIKV